MHAIRLKLKPLRRKRVGFKGNVYMIKTDPHTDRWTAVLVKPIRVGDIELDHLWIEIRPSQLWNLIDEKLIKNVDQTCNQSIWIPAKANLTISGTGVVRSYHRMPHKTQIAQSVDYGLKQIKNVQIGTKKVKIVYLVTKLHYDRTHTITSIEHFAFKKKKYADKFAKENTSKIDDPFFEAHDDCYVEEIKVQ